MGTILENLASFDKRSSMKIITIVNYIGNYLHLSLFSKASSVLSLNNVSTIKLETILWNVKMSIF